MSDDDRRRWDERHAAAVAAGTPPDEPAVLRAAEPWLPRRGRALDVACGRGGAAAALAARGFVVDALDVSLVALAAARELAAARGVARRVRTIACDLDRGLPEGSGPYDLVLCVHFHATSLWPALRGVLAPRGLLVMETLTTRNADLGLGGPSRRFLVPPGELRGAASGLEILLDEEGVIDGRDRARLVARRPAATR
jgi:SAM-dependent methyltransferase